ncbi:MAG: ribosome maturation factor RimP [Cytophagales bacterium]|nr:ribosome maturation factor RimP [Cytophagales bacterium]
MELSSFIEKTLIESEALNHLYLVKLNVNDLGKTKKINVYIDSDGPVTIEDCTKLSRKINKAAEEENLIEGDYTLEVSSPGAESPLLFNRQYKKNIGRNFKVEQQDKTVIEGKLIHADESTVQIEVTVKKNTTIVEIPFSEIKKANVQVTI